MLFLATEKGHPFYKKPVLQIQNVRFLKK